MIQRSGNSPVISPAHALQSVRYSNLSLPTSIPMTPAWSFLLRMIIHSAYYNREFTGLGSWQHAPRSLDFRYTSDTVFDTFPWPQTPTPAQVMRVAQTSRDLRAVRAGLMRQSTLSLRELYRLTELPGDNPLKTAQGELDAAVRLTYGMSPKDDILSFLLALNLDVASVEGSGNTVQAPGIPAGVGSVELLISTDRVEGER